MIVRLTRTEVFKLMDLVYDARSELIFGGPGPDVVPDEAISLGVINDKFREALMREDDEAREGSRDE